MSRLSETHRAEVALLTLVWSAFGLSLACDVKRRRHHRPLLTRLVGRARM